MNILETLEQKYNFQYPKIYHQLYAENMLEFGKAGPTWYTQTYPLLKSNPPLLLFAKEYEFLELEDINEEIERFKIWGIDAKFKLVPFAINGAGDIYCFYLNGQVGNNIPIAFVSHDGGYFEIKTKNMEDFMFRKLVEMVLEELDADSFICDGDFTENTSNMLKTHKKYLPQKQVNILEEIYSRPFNEEGLLSAEEYNKIIADTIYFDQLDHEIQYVE